MHKIQWDSMPAPHTMTTKAINDELLDIERMKNELERRTKELVKAVRPLTRFITGYPEDD